MPLTRLISLAAMQHIVNSDFGLINDYYRADKQMSWIQATQEEDVTQSVVQY